MPSQLKSETARINGAKSHGPVTQEGKARSSHNALRHGLNSAVVVLPHENRADFEALRESYRARFRPADQVEFDLVETMAASRWRLNRLVHMESTILEKGMDAVVDDAGMEMTGEEKLAESFERIANQEKTLALLVRYEGQINRTYERAFKQLQILQKTRPPVRTEEAQPAQRNEPKAAVPELQNEPNPAPPAVLPAFAAPVLRLATASQE